MSHADFDHNQTEELRNQDEEFRKRMEAMTALKQNIITAGDLHGEKVLHEETIDGILIKRLPDDPLALRISIGAPNLADDERGYLVFRGNPRLIEQLLERTLAAFKSRPPL